MMEPYILLTYKKIIAQCPGHTIYAGDTPDQVYHFFNDIYSCPMHGSAIEIHGKGALCHRVSAFLFEKLSQLNIPTHFLGIRNMRESLMQATHALPFKLRIHNRASIDLARDFDIPEDMHFDPPLVEYLTASSKYQANEDFLTAMGWVDQEEMEEIHGLAIRTMHCLQGLFIACDIECIQIELTLARSFENPFVIAGTLAPENLLLRDLRTGQIWNMFLLDDDRNPLLTPYILLAQRLGLYVEKSTNDAGKPMPFTAETEMQSTPSTLDQNLSSIDANLTMPHWPKNVLLFPNAAMPTQS